MSAPERETLLAAKEQAHRRSKERRQIYGVWVSGARVYVRPLHSLGRDLPTPLPKDARLYGKADRDYWTEGGAS